jgi:quercetin dioxygenase-like cupin family protein
MANSETLKAKSLDSPDETRSFENGKMDIVSVDEVTAGRVTLEPGWRWSEAIKPIAGTDSCEVQHTGYVVSGRMYVVMDDGSEQEIGPGDVYVPDTTPASRVTKRTSGWTSTATWSASPANSNSRTARPV